MPPSPSKPKSSLTRLARRALRPPRRDAGGLVPAAQGSTASVAAPRAKPRSARSTSSPARFGMTVFVEVKARAAAAKPRPRRSPRSTAAASSAPPQYYVARHPALADTPLRFDVIFLAPGSLAAPCVNAFDATLRISVRWPSRSPCRWTPSPRINPRGRFHLRADARGAGPRPRARLLRARLAGAARQPRLGRASRRSRSFDKPKGEHFALGDFARADLAQLRRRADAAGPAVRHELHHAHATCSSASTRRPSWSIRRPRCAMRPKRSSSPSSPS